MDTLVSTLVAQVHFQKTGTIMAVPLSRSHDWSELQWSTPSSRPSTNGGFFTMLLSNNPEQEKTLPIIAK